MNTVNTVKTKASINLIDLILIAAMLACAGCGGEDTAQVAKVATVSADPVATPAPTAAPTATPSPTATPTPSPTATPTPSPSPTPYAYSGGDGSMSTPYLLTVPNDVRHIGDHPASYFSMTQTISFEYEAALSPLPAFSGTLYGHNYQIYKPTITGTTENKAALFVSVSGTIVQLNLSQAVVSGTAYVAGFAGDLQGMLSACSITGTITSPSGGNGYNVGVGNPLYVTKGASATIPGSTVNVQFNGNHVTSIF